MAKSKKYDKSIVYKSLLTRLGNKINELKGAKVDTSLLELNKRRIEDRVNTALNVDEPKFQEGFGSAVEIISEEELEQIYGEAIGELEKLLSSAKTYEVYIEVNNKSKTIQDTIDDLNIKREDVEQLASLIINLINKINSSNTRNYNSQESIINYLYSLAYQIIKLEFMYMGTSNVLSWARGNDFSSSFLNDEVYKDAVNYLKDNEYDQMFSVVINKAKSNNSEIPYLDEKVILYLLLNGEDQENIRKRIERILIDINNNLVSKNEKIRSAKAEESEISYNIESFKKSVKMVIAYLSIAAILVAGSYKASKLISGLRFGYDVKSYTTGDTLQAAAPKEYDKYESNSLKLYEFQPWTQANDGYARQYTTYEKNFFSGGQEDVLLSEQLASAIFDGVDQDENLAKMFELLESSDWFKKKTYTETREAVSIDEMYDGIIREVVDVERQNLAFIDEDEANIALMLIILGISYVVLFGGSKVVESVSYNTKLLPTAIRKLRSGEYNKEDLKRKLFKQQSILRGYVHEHREFRKQFVEIYDKFITLLQKESSYYSDFKATYDRLKRDGEKAYIYKINSK